MAHTTHYGAVLPKSLLQSAEIHPAADDWIALVFILREWGGSSGAEEAG